MKNAFLSVIAGAIILPIFIVRPEMPWFFNVLAPVVGGLLGLLFHYCVPSRPSRGYCKRPQEYERRKGLIEKAAKEMFAKVYGKKKYYMWSLDQSSESPWYEEEVWQPLLSGHRIEENEELPFAILVAAGTASEKAEKYDKAIGFLKRAVAIKPNDLVANVKLGEVFEREGAGNDAIRAYESVLQDSSLTRESEAFVLSQIERVRTEGPEKKPPIGGLRRMTW